MLVLLNDILTNYILPGLIFALGICFLFILVPDGAGLRGYRMARRMMGCGYLAFFTTLIFEAMTIQLAMEPVLQQIIILSISILQAFLFTFALTTLIDVQFFSWSRLIRQLIYVILPSVAAFVVYFYDSRCSSVILILLIAYYSYKLVGYVFSFRRRYREYKHRMADYFSSDEWERLRWVRRSFYTALSIGILALIYALCPSVITSLLFTLVLAGYYAAFGIRFINYAFTFHQIEAAMSVNDYTGDNNIVDSGQSSLADVQSTALMQRLTELMTEKQLFTKPDLTIEDISVQAGDSYRNVSAAINNCEGINFKAWVNSFRIQEAKQLIHEGYLLQHTTDALAQATGFSSRISFYRAFKKQTGQSPTDFR
jgi:AraC-like DNA-binding protein